MRQRNDVQVRQDTINFVRERQFTATSPFIAKVINTYSERMTCDLETPDGQKLYNIPVLTQGGLVDGEPYGVVSLPMIDDYVVVMHASFSERHKIIVGTFFPYLANAITKDVVNSGGKAYTKKLFEKDKPKTYRRVFPSGTTVEVDDDGDVTVETPDGTFIKVGDGVEIEDSNGNTIVMGSSSVTINGNLEVLQ